MDAEPRAPNSETSRRATVLPSAEHGAVGGCVQKSQIVEGQIHYSLARCQADL